MDTLYKNTVVLLLTRSKLIISLLHKTYSKTIKIAHRINKATLHVQYFMYAFIIKRGNLFKHKKIF